MRAGSLACLLGAAFGCHTSPPLSEPEGHQVADLVFELLQGEMSGFRGELEDAFDHYYQASLLTEDPRVASRATEIAVWMKDYDRSLKAAQRWRDLVPKNPHPMRVIGSIHAFWQDVPAAVEAYEASIQISPHHLDMDLLAISNSLSSVEAESVRLGILEELARLHPESAHAHLHVAGVARAQDRLAEALAAVRRSVELSPDWPRALGLQADILVQMERIDAAIALLQRSLTDAEREPAGLRQMLADLLNRQGRHDEARMEYELLLGLDPHNPQWQITLGSLTLLSGDLDESREYFLALRDNPRSLVAGQPPAFNRSVSSYFLGLLAEQAGDVMAAMDYFYQVDERDYFGADRYYQKARVRIAQLLLEANGLERARMHLEVSRGRSRLEDNVVQLYVAEGDLLYGLKEYAAGYALMSRGLKRHPRDASLLYSRALLAERMGRLDQLERDLGVVLADNPDDPQALNALGYTWADHNVNLDRALAYIQRAHEQLPHSAAIIDSLGWAHYRLGDLLQAEKFLRQALSMQPDGEVVAHLIEVLWMLGRREEARKIYREAIDRLSDDEFLSRVAQRFAL